MDWALSMLLYYYLTIGTTPQVKLICWKIDSINKRTHGDKFLGALIQLIQHT